MIGSRLRIAHKLPLIVAVAAISVVFERVLYARLYKAPELDQVLLTIGLVFVSIAAVTLAELPLVVMASNASPGSPRARTWRAKISL